LIESWLDSQAYEELLAKPRPKSDRVFVRGLYADLLQRVPEYQEFRRCRNALLALSDSRPLRSVLIKMMLDADLGKIGEPGADRAAFVRGLFLRFLAREPTAKESEGFTRELAAGGDARLLVRALLTHGEYQSY
jgi:muconolactone delta-isomerase